MDTRNFVQRCLAGFALVVLGGCGGGGGGDKPTGPGGGGNTVTSLSIANAPGTLASGATASLTATARNSAGDAVTNASISWSSSNNAVATVSNSGVVTGLLAGPATITAATGTVSSNVSITVTAGAPTALTLRTQPAGAAAGVVFTTQPVLDVKDARGNAVNGATVTASIASGGGTLTGTTSVQSVQGVATFTDLAIRGAANARSLTFAVSGAGSVSSASFLVQPGAPAELIVVISPSGGGLNSSYATQPVIHIRDGFSNVVTSSSATVTANLTSGGGTLTGATANAVNGVATFTSLGVIGSPGTRSISFSAVGIPATATASSTPCDLTRAPQVGFAFQSRTITSFLNGIASKDTIVASDINGSCTALAGIASSVGVGTGGGWLTTTITPDSRVALNAAPGALGLGQYVATINVSSTNGGATALPITMTVRDGYPIDYGAGAQKFSTVNIGTTLTVPVTVRDTLNTVVIVPVGYATRSPGIASVNAAGLITGGALGHAWLVSRVLEQGNRADSILVNVIGTTGAVIRLVPSSLSVGNGGTITVAVVLDTRTTTVGSGEVIFAWPDLNDEPGMFTRTSVPTVNTALNVQAVNDDNTGTARISFVSAGGITGAVTLATYTLRADVIGNGQLTTRFVDLVALNHSSLLGNVSTTQYPIIVR